jgi:PBSX family phage portal protein
MTDLVNPTQVLPALSQTKFLTVEFGDPEPVLNKRAGIMDLLQSRFNGRWYDTPIPMDGLSRAFRASPHHSSAMLLKRDMLLADFVPSKLLSPAEFSGLVLDYVVFGNGYLEELPNRFGTAARYERALAKYIRAGKERDAFFHVSGWKNEQAFAPGSLTQIFQPSLDQEIYGIPEYLSALQSAFLNENATLFRRKYYLNGSHAGYILHLDGQFSDEDMDGIRQAMKDSKGAGNFRNMLLQSTGGSKDSVKLIPISEVAAKDEFLGIKNTTRDDILAAHRTFPQLVAVVPQNTGGFGNMAEAVQAFRDLVIEPLKMQLLEINTLTNREVIAFKDPVKPAA